MWFKNAINNKKNQKEAQGLKYIEIPGRPDAKTICLFHGFGADHHDLVSLANCAEENEFRWIFPRGPLSVQTGWMSTGRAWFYIDIPLLQEAIETGDFSLVDQAFPDGVGEVENRLNLFLDEVCDRSKLILGGFSQGAVLATQLALENQKPASGLVIFSGTLFHKKALEQKAEKCPKIPFLQTHGIEDPILPYRLAEDLHQLLESKGHMGSLISFDGGHEIDESVFSAFQNFLKKI